MNSSNEWEESELWDKSMTSFGGTLHYGSRSDGSKAAGKQPGIGNINRLSKKGLINRYLCDGSNSQCVQRHRCECLDVCKYGQRYLQIVEEEKQKKKPSKRKTSRA